MSTILTDDELPSLPELGPEWTDYWRKTVEQKMRQAQRAVEAAVLAKLAQQEPVAWRYKKEGGGWFVSDNEPQYVEQWNDIEEVQPLYTHPTPQQADRQRVPDGWKVEALSDGCVRVYGPDNETWRLQANPGQGTFEDFAHRFLSAIAAAPEAPAQAKQAAELVPATVVQALEALDELEAAARGDEPFNHFAAPLIRQALKHSMLAAAPEAPAQASAVDERAEFEAWVLSKGGAIMTRDGVYVSSMTELWWECWQARAALAQPEDIKRESKPRMCPNTFNYCSRSCGDGDCRDFVDAFPASNAKNGGAA